MRSSSRFLIIVLLCAALALCAGCGKKAKSGKWVVGMSQCTEDEPWRVQMDDDVKKYAAEYPDDIELIVKVAEDKVEVQQNQMREFIDLGVDCIIISPKESQPLTQPVAEAIDAGIPVIVLDRKVEGDKYTCFIGADNVMIGEAAGQFVVKQLGGKGTVVELKGLMTSTPGQERHDGFIKGLGEHYGKGPDKIEIIFDADCAWKETLAQNEMKSALQRFDKIDFVYGHNDPSAHGAWTAAQQEGKGREKTIKFIGIDALPHEGIRYVKDGILTASFEYQNGAKEAIENVLKLKNGEGIPKNITLGTKMYTKENVDQGGEVITAESLHAGG